MLTLNHYFIFGAIVFMIGLYGVLAKKNIIMILISIDFMLNAANINLIAISKYVAPPGVLGQLFSIFVMIVTAAEIGVGLGIVIYLYRSHVSVQDTDFNIMKG